VIVIVGDRLGRLDSAVKLLETELSLGDSEAKDRLAGDVCNGGVSSMVLGVASPSSPSSIAWPQNEPSESLEYLLESAPSLRNPSLSSLEIHRNDPYSIETLTPVATVATSTVGLYGNGAASN
jgi:hypothetical protein